MPSDIIIMIDPENEDVYVELRSLARFLRSGKNAKEGDEVYNEALNAIAEFLLKKEEEFLAEHVLMREADDLKDKGRLN